jgi:hypothetical protein
MPNTTPCRTPAGRFHFTHSLSPPAEIQGFSARAIMQEHTLPAARHLTDRLTDRLPDHLPDHLTGHLTKHLTSHLSVAPAAPDCLHQINQHKPMPLQYSGSIQASSRPDRILRACRLDAALKHCSRHKKTPCRITTGR